MDEVEQDPEEIFHDCLIGLGFAVNAIEALAQEGVETIEGLLSLSTNDLKELRMHLLAEVRNRVGNAAKPRFPYVSFKKLMAMHEWGQCMKLLGQEPDPATFVLGVVRRWEERLQELELIAKTAVDHPEVPKFAKFDEWQLWDEKFRSHLHTQRSAVAGTPLTYVIRDEVEGARGAEDGAADGNNDADDEHQGNIDDLLVAKRTLTGPSFMVDNRRVWEIMKPLIHGGPAWSFLQKYDARSEGRVAYLALKAEAEGTSASTTRKAKAYQQIATAQYTGRGRYSFDQYVERHQSAHNELAYLKEPVPEAKKVTDFLRHITDPRLNNAKDHIAGDKEKLESFERCQQYLKQILSNHSITTGEQRNVAAVQVERDGSKSAKKAAAEAKKEKKRKEREGDAAPGTVHGGRYTNKEYRNLTEKQKEEVKKLRAEKAKKEEKDAPKRQIGGLTTVREVAAVSEPAAYPSRKAQKVARPDSPDEEKAAAIPMERVYIPPDKTGMDFNEFENRAKTKRMLLRKMGFYVPDSPRPPSPQPDDNSAMIPDFKLESASKPSPKAVTFDTKAGTENPGDLVEALEAEATGKTPMCEDTKPSTTKASWGKPRPHTEREDTRASTTKGSWGKPSPSTADAGKQFGRSVWKS